MLNEIVVHAARPEHALVAAGLLQQHGVACRVVQGPPMGFPWVMLALPLNQVVVPAHRAEQARETLQSLHLAETGAARDMARLVRWRLAAIALSGIGMVAFGMAPCDPRCGAARSGIRRVGLAEGNRS